MSGINPLPSPGKIITRQGNNLKMAVKYGVFTWTCQDNGISGKGPELVAKGLSPTPGEQF